MFITSLATLVRRPADTSMVKRITDERFSMDLDVNRTRLAHDTRRWV
jgi:hypothetical protein